MRSCTDVPPGPLLARYKMACIWPLASSVLLNLLAFAAAARRGLPATGTCLADCHGTDCSQRLLNHTVSVDDPTLTRRSCWAGCGASGYALAGVEAGHGCFCAHALAWSVSPLPASQCCTPCAGNGSEFCGARFRVEVLVTDQPLPSSGQTSGCPLPPAEQHPIDPRHIANGTVMLRSGYLDQPYCVVLPPRSSSVMGQQHWQQQQQHRRRQPRWVCTVTGSTGGEGSHGEHVQSLWSDDAGRHWSQAVTVEPPPLNARVANAYSTIVLGPAGRVYVIYNMNVNNVTKFPTGKAIGRTDCQGQFVMRWSEDGGETFSAERLVVPYRLTSVDSHNDFGGTTKEMWTVDQTKVRGGVAYFAFTKIEHYLLAPPEELWVLASPNILTEQDPRKVTWSLRPSGDHGLAPPFHNVSDETTVIEEAHVVPLNQSGGFYMIGRTTMGYVAAAWTLNADADEWGPTRYAQYWDPASNLSTAAGNRLLVPLQDSASAFGGGATVKGAGLKNPRGPITTRMLLEGSQYCAAGTHLLLYYNNLGKDYSPTSRNPYWLAAGLEAGGQILWSQPEISIYDRLRATAPGYPDIIQDPLEPGRVVITETEKHTARLHVIPTGILSALCTQLEVNTTAEAGGGAHRLLVEHAETTTVVATPDFGRLDGHTPRLGAGLTVAVVLTTGPTLPMTGRPDTSSSGAAAQTTQTLVDSRNATDRSGILVEIDPSTGVASFLISDGARNESLSTDRVCSQALSWPGSHFLGFVVDAGPLIIRVLVDGVLCDGGGTSPRGWAWFKNAAGLGSVRGAASMQIGNGERSEMVTAAATRHMKLDVVQLYTRALMTSELVGNARAALERGVKNVIR